MYIIVVEKKRNKVHNKGDILQYIFVSYFCWCVNFPEVPELPIISESWSCLMRSAGDNCSKFSFKLSFAWQNVVSCLIITRSTVIICTHFTEAHLKKKAINSCTSMNSCALPVNVSLDFYLTGESKHILAKGQCAWKLFLSYIRMFFFAKKNVIMAIRIRTTYCLVTLHCARRIWQFRSSILTAF